MKENAETNCYIDSIFEAAIRPRKSNGNKRQKDRCVTAGVSSSSKNLREIRLNTGGKVEIPKPAVQKESAIPNSKRTDLQRLIKAQLSKK